MKHHEKVFRDDLKNKWVMIHANSIQEKGLKLDSFFSVIDCMKIQISRWVDNSADQLVCYSGHKTFYCLIFLTVTTRDGPVFNLYEPGMKRRQDLSLFRQGSIREHLKSNFISNGTDYCLCEDARATLNSARAVDAENSLFSALFEGYFWLIFGLFSDASTGFYRKAEPL